jgi:hypothetical protein
LKKLLEPTQPNSSNYPLSIVIATLGGDTLENTISLVNKSSVIPKEILICIPEKEVYNVSNLSFPNIKIVPTNCRGQVPQRVEGFKQAKYNFVLQMDDDVELETDTIASLIKLLSKLGPSNAIGPSFYDPITMTTLHKFDFGQIGFLKSLNSYVFSAAPWGRKRMGKITTLGIGFGVDPKLCKKDICKVDWLPGGCVLNYKQDLIVENYFPLAGKAFSEDIVHSILRTSNDIKHYVAVDTIAKTGVEENNFNWGDFKTELKARLYVVKLIRGNNFRLFIWGVNQFLTRQLKWR